MRTSKRYLFAAAGGVLMATLLLAAGSANGAAALGSFKCYITQGNPNTNVAVTLEDQFDTATGVVESLGARAAQNVCVPAAVTHKNSKGAITNAESLLTLYRLNNPDGTNPNAPDRTATVSNVFGVGQSLAVFTPQHLGVPTTEAGAAGAHDLDNFKCYVSRGDAPKGGSQVMDRYGSDKGVKVLEPVLLCNPAKLNGGAIGSAAEHLVCYNLKTTPFSGSISITNSISTETLSLGLANMLCVPTTLDAWAPVTP